MCNNSFFSIVSIKKHPADVPDRVTATVVRVHVRQARVSSVVRVTEGTQDEPGGLHTKSLLCIFSILSCFLSPSRRFFWVVYHFILQIQYLPPFLPFSWKSLGIRGLPAPVTPPVLLAFFKKHPAEAPERATATVARVHERQARVSSVVRGTEGMQDVPGGIVVTP